MHDQHQTPKSDIQIAQEAHMLPIAQIGHRKLASKEDADKRKEYWDERLAALAQVLAARG